MKEKYFEEFINEFSKTSYKISNRFSLYKKIFQHEKLNGQFSNVNKMKSLIAIASCSFLTQIVSFSTKSHLCDFAVCIFVFTTIFHTAFGRSGVE
jgi:hypothetical protein